ncbi:MAG: hypothetical protein J1E41_06060, partial [Ruminococcus sp.]|nr:hypothetical protein [Ruminococcus sp.]
MKTSFKKITSIFLAVLMLVSVMTVSGVMVSAADTDSVPAGASTVVLDASFCDEGGYAEWYAWTWSEGSEGHWVQASGGTNSSDITYDGIEDWVVFARMNPEKQLPSWNTEYDDQIVWNQTEDLYVEGGIFIIDSWGDGYGAKLTGHWEGDVGGGGDYYLVGKINGVDVEGNEYQFYDGFLTMTLYEESYVAVKDGRGDWYMTHGFPGFEATSASLYKTYFGEEGTDKLYVPAGEVTFTLTDYGNGELYLSYSVYQEQTTSPIITDPPTTSPIITDPPTTAPPATTAPVITDPPVTTQPASTIPTEPTEADEDQNLYVSAKSNINLIGSKVKVIGNTVTVSYTLKTPEKLDDAQYFVTYDSTKLVLSTSYNTQSSMFPIAKDTTYNLGAGLSMAKFNFSGTDGAYDFTNGGVLVKLVFTRKSSTTVGTALVYLNIGDLNSKNTTFVNDGKIENSAGLEVGQNISSAPVVEPTDEDVATDPNPNLTINASSNISPAVQKIAVDKSHVKVTYKMTVPEIIAYGKGVVTYDSDKLALEAKYNTQSSMFTTLNTQTIYNLNAGTGTMMFSFTSADPETQSGTYDFRAGGDVITLVFTVRQGATGSADVYLDLMDLGSFGKDYFEQGNATSSAGDVTSDIVIESQQATTSDVSETTLPIATTTEDTTPGDTSVIPTTTVTDPETSVTTAPTTVTTPTAPTTKAPTTPKPTTPKPTQPTTAKPAPNV